MYKVLVEYDYKAKEPDELTIRKGDIILNVVKKSGGWWEGVLGDKKGMFPDNFVHPLEEDSSVVIRSHEDKSSSRQCRVIFSYSQDHEDELNLKVGDIIDIIGEEEEGWWRGKINGKEGVFPSNFVQELIWQPNPSSRKISSSIDNEKNGKSCQLSSTSSKKICEAKFSYKAQNADELSFQEGDLITVLNTDSQDPGWWYGELNGNIGVFPDNFVVLVSDKKGSKSEKNKSFPEKGAIESAQIASQRKLLGHSKEIENEKNVVENKSSLAVSKSFEAIKKSSPNSDELLSELRNKIRDTVDGHAASKQVAEKSSENYENTFDLIQRRPLLTDLRATRAKAPGRRPPSVSHGTTNNEEPTWDSNMKPRLRKVEEGTLPWLEEMKKNQFKKSAISTLERKWADNTNNSEVDTSPIVLPFKLKSPKDSEEKGKLNHVCHIQEEISKKSPKDSFITSTPAELKRKGNNGDILERLERLEDLVQKQNDIIEDLQNKLQLEIDKRILLQEKIKHA